MNERLCVLDTETTGLNAQLDDVIEIGVLELVNRVPSGRTLHQYFKPAKLVEPGAVRVHGITNEFLADKPRFSDHVESIKDFLEGATLIIHNAPFDVGFINSELARLQDDWRIEQNCEVVDTLVMARDQFPGLSNSLDALCSRFGINAKHRTLHGALLDAELLMQVYLAMTRRQHGLWLPGLDQEQGQKGANLSVDLAAYAGRTAVHYADEREQAAHEELLAKLGKESGRTLWSED